jgi:hypothetical protein
LLSWAVPGQIVQGQLAPEVGVAVKPTVAVGACVLLAVTPGVVVVVGVEVKVLVYVAACVFVRVGVLVGVDVLVRARAVAAGTVVGVKTTVGTAVAVAAGGATVVVGALVGMGSPDSDIRRMSPMWVEVESASSALCPDAPPSPKYMSPFRIANDRANVSSGAVKRSNSVQPAGLLGSVLALCTVTIWLFGVVRQLLLLLAVAALPGHISPNAYSRLPSTFTSHGLYTRPASAAGVMSTD